MPGNRPDHASDRAAGLVPPVAVVVSRYNASITDRLLEGAIAEYEGRGGRADGVTVLEAPGAYELPAIALAAARTGRFAAVVALGCLIRGETRHDRHIAGAVANGLVSVTMQTGLPAAFGVITAEDADQARARAGGKKGNKGKEAMAAALDAAAVIAALGAPAGDRAARIVPAADKAAAAEVAG